MNETSIYKGNLLDIIKSNSISSIRGKENPHLIFTSSFLFMDHDFNSFSHLYNLYKNTDNDIVSFYFGLCYLGFKGKLDKQLDDYKLEKEFKNIKFKDKNLKKTLKCISSFINKNDIKSFNEIEVIKVENDIKLLSLAFCFKYSNLTLSEYFNLFPDFHDFFIFEDDCITLSSNKKFLDLINNNGLLAIFFVGKFYHLFNLINLKFILNQLFIKKVFDVFILHKFLSTSYDNSELINDFVILYKDYQPFIDEKILLSSFHYVLLNSYLLKKYDPIILWFNQFTEKLNNGDLKTDFDNFIDWNLDDLKFEQVSYWYNQKNARFYINSLPTLIQTRDSKNNSLNSSESLNKSIDINIIGGSNVLAWHDACSPDFNIDISFHYTNRFFSNENFFDLNDKDISFFSKKNHIPIIFNFEPDLIINSDPSKYLSTLLNIIKNSYCFLNIHFLKIPYPSILSHTNHSYYDILNIINNFNNSLVKLKDEYSFNIINTNDYLDIIEIDNKSFSTLPFSSLFYTSDENLLCNYYLKPDIIKNLL